MSDRLQNFYSKLYLSEKHDSPDVSRVSLSRRIIKTLKVGIPSNEILNIGSGPQAIEKQLWNMNENSFLREFKFSTIDIAKINYKKLLKRENSNINHSQASALSLPYDGNLFGLVFSNHAIDFLSRTAFDEAFRVLKTGGSAIFYFHHPDMIPDDISVVRNTEIRNFWSHLKETDHLFSSEQQIVNEMSDHGFGIRSIELNSDDRDKWWEVELTK